MGGPSRVTALLLAVLVGWFGSLYVAALFEWDPRSIGVASVTCPTTRQDGHDIVHDDCEPHELLFRTIGTAWPPLRPYALLIGAAAGILMFVVTRPQPTSHPPDG